MDPNSSTTEPDLSFASLLFSIITCAASLLLEPELKAIGISLPTKESYTNLLDQWNIATMDLLRLSRFYEKPNVNSLLAIISMRIYSHRRNKWGPYILLSSLALRAAELIGLDKLGTAREDEIRWQKDRELEKAGTPPPKRTEYGSGSHILREVGRRVSIDCPISLVFLKRSQVLTARSTLVSLTRLSSPFFVLLYPRYTFHFVITTY